MWLERQKVSVYNAYCSWERALCAASAGRRAVSRRRRGRTAAGRSSRTDNARTASVRGRGISMDPLHSQHYLRIKSCFPFFRRPNLSSYLSILTRVLRFIQSQVARTTCLTSFFIDDVQTLDDRGRGRIFISFTFRFSGPGDSLINSQIMRLNVSSPHLDWFRFFLFRFICVNAAAGSHRRRRDRIGTAIGMDLLFC